MSQSLTEQANKAALETVKSEKPSQFTVGGNYDFRTRTVEGGVTYDRRWLNGWGATAYAKAWWQNQPVTTVGESKSSLKVGGEIVKTFVLACVFVLAAASSVLAQVPAQPGQLFKWDQPTAEVSTVVRFEMRIDAGAFVDVGRTAANDAATPAGFSSFSRVIPALTPGNHTFVVRACSATSCGPDSNPFAFAIIVISQPSGLRIGMPGQ